MQEYKLLPNTIFIMKKIIVLSLAIITFTGVFAQSNINVDIVVDYMDGQDYFKTVFDVTVDPDNSPAFTFEEKDNNLPFPVYTNVGGTVTADFAGLSYTKDAKGGNIYRYYVSPSSITHAYEQGNNGTVYLNFKWKRQLILQDAEHALQPAD